MLAAVQPDRLQLGQRRAYGGGAHARFRQVGAYARDHVGAAVGAVYAAVDVDHHAGLVGQDGEVTGVGNRVPQPLQYGLGGLHQLVVGILVAPCFGGGQDVEGGGLLGALAAGQAAQPGALYPAFQGRRGIAVPGFAV